MGHKFAVKVSCEGVPMKALNDSEAMASLITPGTLESTAGNAGGRILDRIRKCQGEVVRDVSEGQIKLLGSTENVVEHGGVIGVIQPMSIYIAESIGNTEPVLSGMKAMRRCKAWREKVKNYCFPYPSAFLQLLLILVTITGFGTFFEVSSAAGLEGIPINVLFCFCNFQDEQGLKFKEEMK